MGWEVSDVVIFDLWPLLQVKVRIANLKVLITRLLLDLEVWDMKPTCRKYFSRNLLMYCSLASLSFFFGGVDTICISSPMHQL